MAMAACSRKSSTDLDVVVVEGALAQAVVA